MSDLGTADAVLRLLLDGQPRTRAELIERSGLARSTVTGRIEALLAEVRMHCDSRDAAGVRTVATEAVRQLNAYRSLPGMDTGERALVIKTLTNNLAAPLTMAGYYDLALPLWEQIATDWLPNMWSYAWYAECVWVITRDRERALAMLRQAAARRFDAEIRTWFVDEAKGFADVRDDPEFLAALTPSAL